MFINNVLISTDEFGCFRWSHSDTHLLYVAEKKKPKFKSYFEKRAATEKESDVKRVRMLRCLLGSLCIGFKCVLN